MGISGTLVTQGGSARIAQPRFSIITSSYNQGQFLEETIKSVLAQGRSDVEHIVIDGGSTDNSVDILRRYDDSLAYWISAKDAGQASAWNTGIRLARGEIIGIINSDDLYLPGAFDEIERLARSQPLAEWLVGGTRYFGPGSHDAVHEGKAQLSAADVLFFVSYAPQPGHFFRRTLVDRVGTFDESLHYSFDLDFFVRCALAGAVSAGTPTLVAAFRFHDASKSIRMKEIHRAETLAVEARYWPVIRERQGAYARKVRAALHGELGLQSSRDAVDAGERVSALRHLVTTTLHYPGVLKRRAYYGIVQRLLGLRRSR